MKAFLKSIGVLFCCAFAFLVMSNTADAATIKITDQYGYSEVLLDVDSEYLIDNSVSTFGYIDDGTVPGNPDSTPPNPQLLIPQIEHLKDYYAEYGFPKSCNFVLVDLGPNWENVIINDNEPKMLGRYIYLFYGKYNSKTDNVETGETVTGNDKDYGQSNLTFVGSSSDHPDDRTLVINSPFSFVVYNNDTDKAYCYVTKGYDTDTLDGIWSIEFEGITVPVDDAYSNYYPQLIRFNDYDTSYLTFWGSFTLGYAYDYYHTSWGDWNGTVSYEVHSDKSIWDAIQDGQIIESDNPAAQVFTKALQGIANVVDFVQEMPTVFHNMLSFLPAPIVDFIMVCLGIVLTIIILKLALHVVG